MQFWPLVARTARRSCASAADADDVVQEVWLALLNNIDKIHSPSCLPGWLRTVTLHAAIEHGRRNSRSIALPSIPDPAPAHGEDPTSAELVLNEARLAVNAAAGRLSPAEQILLSLLMAEDRPNYRLISEEIGRPVGSLGPTRRRLIERMSHDPAIVQLAAY